MSFDIFFQRFEGGDSATAGGEEARLVLAPYLRPSAAAPERIEHAGSVADVYGLNDGGMMVNHIEGDGLWDVLVEAARAAEWTIMPTDCAVCVFSQEMLDALPEGLDADAVIISSGAQLSELILAT